MIVAICIIKGQWVCLVVFDLYKNWSSTLIYIYLYIYLYIIARAWKLISNPPRSWQRAWRSSRQSALCRPCAIRATPRQTSEIEEKDRKIARVSKLSAILQVAADAHRTYHYAETHSVGDFLRRAHLLRCNAHDAASHCLSYVGISDWCGCKDGWISNESQLESTRRAMKKCEGPEVKVTKI